MSAAQPEPTPPQDEADEIVRFHSEEEFRAWAHANVADADAWIQQALDGLAEWHAWEASGNPGLPPGAILWRDYKRAHSV